MFSTGQSKLLSKITINNLMKMFSPTKMVLYTRILDSEEMQNVYLEMSILEMRNESNL